MQLTGDRLRAMDFDYPRAVPVSVGILPPGWGLAARPFSPPLSHACFERVTEAGETPKARATWQALIPCPNSLTAVRRRCSNSAADPLVLMPKVLASPAPSFSVAKSNNRHFRGFRFVDVERKP